MTRWLGLLAALLLMAAAPRAIAQAEEAQRQVLVMLHLPKAHYRPDGSYAGSYGTAVGRQSRQRVAQDLARRHGLEMRSDWPMPLAGVDCFVMRLPEGDPRSSTDAARVVAEDRRVAWAQPVGLYQAEGSAQEPLYAAQPAAQQWRLAELHQLATGRGVRVAVIDSGVQADHPDLAGQVAHHQNFVDDRAPPAEGHGTAVAGIIAARADNGVGIAGVAPQARLLALRACWQAGSAQTLCSSLSLAKALYAAVQQGAHIINMSLGGPDDRLLALLLDQAQARGAAIVAALPARDGPGSRFPASHPGVLVVGNAPPLPAGAVFAPGRDVPSTVPGGGWAVVTGSSFAAAHAAGLLALVRELDMRALPATALVTAIQGRIDGCATLARFVGSRAAACRPLGQTAD